MTQYCIYFLSLTSLFVLPVIADSPISCLAHDIEIQNRADDYKIIVDYASKY